MYLVDLVEQRVNGELDYALFCLASKHGMRFPTCRLTVGEKSSYELKTKNIYLKVQTLRCAYIIVELRYLAPLKPDMTGRTTHATFSKISSLFDCGPNTWSKK